MEDRNIAINIKDLKKRYRLGVIGGGTLQKDIQSWWANVRHKEDPNSIIGQKGHIKNETFMALDGIDLTVYKGERLGIIGHNGAGKSTLLKLLSRVTGPTEGEIDINGRISSMLEVGTGFNPELTGRENIYLNGAILGMTKAEVDDKMDEIIEFSECRKFIDTPVKRYSSGMYVKLAFSVAAHLDSEILVMDEVLAVGDMMFQQKCLNKMSDVSKKEGRTILYVSHNMNTIRQLCERCIVMDHGKIIFSGDVEEAIALYLGMSACNETSIDYTDIPRLNYLSDTRIKTISAEYIDKQDIQFSAQEKMKVHLKWTNEEDVADLCLRIEILKPDRTPIGTGILYNFYSGKKGETGEAVFSLNLSGLVKGRYATNYVFFNMNQFGSGVNVDGVNGLDFEIVNFEEPLEWQSHVWGNIRFYDVNIEVDHLAE